MVSELLIRPGLNDHEIVQDLLAPGVLPMRQARPPISRLVVDATSVSKRPEFSQAASAAGIPLMVDPLTPLFQVETREDDAWTRLPFGRSNAVTEPELADKGWRRELVSAVVEFQIDAGATVIIPPYLYSNSPDDPNFQASLNMVLLTAENVADQHPGLPVFPILTAQMKGFTTGRDWTDGIDRFASAAADAGAESLGMCISPAGSGADSYSKVFRLFQVADRLALGSVPVIAWRQGIYGEALTGIGLLGYETGIGTKEQSNVARLIANRRVRPDGRKKKGGAGPGVYLEPLGRSVTTVVAQVLLGHLGMRPKVMCDDESCCPNGPTSTLDHRREHAVRTRSRTLRELDAVPQRRWRLNKVARTAANAATVSTQANKVLREERVKGQIRSSGMESLARVAEYISRLGEGEHIAS